MVRKSLMSGAVACLALAALSLPSPATADHVGAHATPCDQPATVGGGALGVSPGPVGPPSSLGWDVGSGQCNGSFSVTSDPAFPGGALELALRAEQRRVGQVAQTGPNDFTVQTGPDVGPPAANNRAWWNFQSSIAYGGSIADLDALTLEIMTDVGPNLPAAPVVDLLAIRGFIDARNSQPNATTGFADLYQFSQNPEFGWFSPTSDTDANPTGAFDYDAPGAWRFRITATEGGTEASLTTCFHTPGESCVLNVPSGKQVGYTTSASLEQAIPALSPGNTCTFKMWVGKRSDGVGTSGRWFVQLAVGNTWYIQNVLNGSLASQSDQWVQVEKSFTVQNLPGSPFKLRLKGEWGFESYDDVELDCGAGNLVTDGGFESPTIPDGTWSSFSNPPPDGWTTVGAGAGLFNPNTTQMDDFF